MNAITNRPQVADMVRLRNEALEMFAVAHDRMTETSDMVEKARRLGLLAAPGSSSYLMGHEEEKTLLGMLKVPPREEFLATARKVLDRNVWSRIIEITDLERLMDKQAKDELRQQMMNDPAEVTEDNVYATLETFMASADEIFARGIANVFAKLDRRFRSHDGFKVGARMIIDRVFDDSGYWSFYSGHKDTLMDIERTFCVLEGKEVPASYAGLVGLIDETRQRQGWGAKQTELESDYFRIRIFKNGNVHLWFTRDDLVLQVNKLLAAYYGEVIGDANIGEEDPFANKKLTPARAFGFFPTPPEAGRRVIDLMKIERRAAAGPVTILEPSAGTGNLARLFVGENRLVSCIEIQADLANALRATGAYQNVQCADFLMVQPTQKFALIGMNPPFDRERDIDHVVHALDFLEPDGRLVAIMSAGVEFRETRKSQAFRNLVEKLHGKFFDLPAGSFKASGTNVNTCIVVINKNGTPISPWE